MTVLRRLKAYLDENEVKYEVLVHPETYRAPATAEALHVPGKEMAKVVMLKDGGDDLMAVLPSTFKLDLHRLREVLSSQTIRLATEEEMAQVFPDCEVGMMPPFGNLYGLDVLVDGVLTEDEEIVFPAGTAREAIKMGYDDFEELVVPRVVEFSDREVKY
jgi:Ala-tRNA(Pro) deacylase